MFKDKLKAIETLKDELKTISVHGQTKLNDYITSLGQTIPEGIHAIDLLRRPGIEAYSLAQSLDIMVEPTIAKQVELEVKYHLDGIFR